MIVVQLFAHALIHFKKEPKIIRSQIFTILTYTETQGNRFLVLMTHLRRTVQDVQ